MKRAHASLLAVLASGLVFVLTGQTSSWHSPPTAKKIVSSLAQLATRAGASAQVGSYRVVKVVDGDTLDVDLDGTTTRIRLIGINTPETVDPRKPVQCFGKEASNHAKELLTGQTVQLESDPTQGERDKYGRLLRYVFLADGSNFNLSMIKDGYAFEYTYNVPYKYQLEFKAAQLEAQATKRGLWAADTCAGKLVPAK